MAGEAENAREQENAELRKRLDEEVGRLNRLVEITGLLNSTLKLEDLLGLIMSSATELLDAETSSLFLLDETSGELTAEIATGEPGQAVEKQRVPAGSGIAGWVVANDEPAVVDEPKTIRVSTARSTKARASRRATCWPCRCARKSVSSAPSRSSTAVAAALPSVICRWPRPWPIRLRSRSTTHACMRGWPTPS